MKNFVLSNIHKSFGKNQVLKGFDLECSQGQALMLVGPNGSGKSTLLRILLGLIEADHGYYSSDGKAVQMNNAYKKHIGYLPENIAFCETLSGREVLKFFVSARGLPRSRVDEMLRWCGLYDAGKRRTGTYSKGMRQRLGLAIAVLHKPSLLILDEPTSGLDQEGLSLLWQVIEEFRHDKRMVLLTSHSLGLLERRIDKICVLKNGRQLFFGTPDELRLHIVDKVVVRIYLKEGLDGIADETDHISESLTHANLSYTVPHVQERTLHLNDAEMAALWPIIALFSECIARFRTEEPVLEEIYERVLAEKS